MCAFSAHARTDRYFQRMEGNDIQTAITSGTPMVVTDDQFTTMSANPSWSTLFTNHKVKHLVRLSLNPEVMQTATFSGALSLQIKYWHWDNVTQSFLTTTVNRTLSVDYSTIGTAIIDEQATYYATGAHKMEVTVLSNTGLDLDKVFLQGEIEIERYYAFNGAAISGTTWFPGQANLAGSDIIEFNWPLQNGAEYYELEWVHINDYTAASGGALTSELTYNFYLNSTRLILRSPNYVIPNLFDRGYILFRVRGIGLQGTDFTIRKEGQWNAPESGSVLSFPAAQLIHVDADADPNMNWNHQVAYTENGKRLEGVSYADGLGRVRQNVAHNPVKGQVMVSNVYYDAHGRAALSDLPTPVNGESLVHQLHFNLADLPEPVGYGVEHFDYELEEGGCVSKTIGFSNQSGAGKYYSDNNENQDGENAMIPDGGGYPFSRVEYMNDHTGRVKRVGSYGIDFKTGSGHDAQFFYSTPLQSELDQLFGAEVGYNTHYQKRFTVDANGQVYMEFFDMAGRVVASGMAGVAPDALDQLDNNSVDPNFLSQYIDGTAGQTATTVPASITFSYADYIANSADYHFNYSLKPANYTYAECLPSDPEICFDCAYKLTIRISDDCGVPVYAFDTIINGEQYDAICNGDTLFAMPEKLLSLSAGLYHIEKKLEVDQDAIDQYWCTFVESNTCEPTYAEIFNALYIQSDFDLCYEDALPAVDEDDPCSVGYLMMLSDLRPGGQYAEYTLSGTTATATSTISVLNSNTNVLGSGNHWRSLSINYLNTDNTPALIEVQQVSPGVYLPALVSGAVVTGPLSNGNYQTRPQYLANLKDFIHFYRQNLHWAESLLSFHPEYCYYQFCLSNAGSHQYDNDMAAITSFTEACSLGYFNPLNTGIVNGGYMNPCGTAAAVDPFFNPPLGHGSTFKSNMQAAMEDYITIDGTHLSIWQYAILLATCPEATTTAEITGCVKDGDKDCFGDLAYIKFVELYQQLKMVYYHKAEDAMPNCDNSCIGSANSSSPCTTSPGSHFINAVPRWGVYTQAQSNGTGLPSDPAGNASASAAAVCSATCEAYADEWMAALYNCPFVDNAQRELVKNDLIAVCMYGCDEYHPASATSLPPIITPATFSLPSGYTLTGGNSFHDVLKKHFGNNYESEICTELLISEPSPYREEIVPQGVYLDDCGCNKLIANYLQFQSQQNIPPGVTTIEQLIAYNLGINLPDAESMLCRCRDAINNEWEPGMVWSPSQIAEILSHKIVTPEGLSCERCTDCATVEEILSTLDSRFSHVTDFENSPQYPVILTNTLNHALGFHLPYSDYRSFIGSCEANVDEPYCELTPEILSLSKVLNLIAHRGELMATQSAPVNLYTDNVVYLTSPLRTLFGTDTYYTTLSDDMLTLYFGAGSCKTVLAKGSHTDLDYNNIIGFGGVSPVGNSCTENTEFLIEVKYLSCGEIRTAWLEGTSLCFPVQICSCEPITQLCDKTDQDQFADNTPCYEPTLSQIYQQAEEQYLANVAALYQSFKIDYNNQCAEAFSTEQFSRKGPNNTYQFTLFYYDQSGNLVKTVAPKGVTLQTDLTAAKNSRNNTTGIDNQAPVTGAIPVHTYITEYRHNSYNQPIYTTNPDQEGATEFWYDHSGRIVASQNPVQAKSGELKYSYTLYDQHNRPKETGQVSRIVSGSTISPFTEDLLKQDDNGAGFKNWVYSGTRTEVTITTYDRPLSAAISAKFEAGQQQHLRLRVATVAYYDAVNNATNLQTGYTSAVHYSYDLHGNVIESLQDVPQMAPVEQDIKSTQYAFELLSGNVNSVEYQKGKRDQMTHSYSYDKLNRLTEVHTSTDGVHRTSEAKYFYYDYGPLARTEIGKHQVQGQDFAYTINGWLKGMNSNTLNPDRDGGRDGVLGYSASNPDIHRKFAIDITGYTLGYYQGDYRGIGAPDFEAEVYTSSPNDFSSTIPNLYNGNIAHLVTAIQGYNIQGTAYRYDQLQRLKSMRVFRSVDIESTNNWAKAKETDEYYNSYTYDANGNIQSLLRNGITSTGLDMDRFTYHYVNVAGNASNRLGDVTDGGTNYAGYSDIKSGMASGNFTYDEIGNLVSDLSEGIQEIQWYKSSKKIKKIVRNSTKPNADEIEFVYDPFGKRVLKIIKPRSGGVVSAPQFWKRVYYASDANGQEMAIYDVDLSGQEARVKEQHIYGASRLGVVASSKLIYSGLSPLPAITDIAIQKLGQKNYELTNYLGNVNAVITDRKTPALISAKHLYEAVVVMKSDYYPYGMQMPGRNENSGEYRYGYNGMEKDAEMKGEGNSYTTEFRQYDPRLGRWLSLDPLMKKFPWMSPYVAFNNNPVFYIDPLGLEGGPAKQFYKGTTDPIDPKALDQISKNVSVFNIDMSKAPARFMGRPTKAVNGRKWNAQWFWSEAVKKDKSWFSEANQKKISEGVIPEMDDVFFKKMTKGVSAAEVAKLAQIAPTGSVLQHHHMNHTNIAVPLAQKVHTGGGNTKFWHNPSFRNGVKPALKKIAKVGIKAFVVAGVVLSVSDAFSSGNFSGGLIPTVDWDKDWHRMIQDGLIEDNFEKLYIGLKMLKKNTEEYTIHWMTVDQMISFQNDGKISGKYAGNVPAYKNISSMSGSDIYPYLMIKYKGEFLGIVTVPD